MVTQNEPEFLIERIPALVAQFREETRVRSIRSEVRILVVEDKLFSRRILQEVLRKDFIVDLAPSARSGMRLYLEHAPDITLLDIDLIEDSGHTLANFIKALDPDSYIAMVSAHNSIEDVNEAKLNKVEAFIVKPFNKTKIGEMLNSYYKLHPDRKPEGTEE